MKVFISSVMAETWQERKIAKELLENYGHAPIMKANYESGPRNARETVYHSEPTAELIDGCDLFIMIPRLYCGLTSASGRSIVHEELVLAGLPPFL